jgi:mannose-6-phosphate isomerase-like protein (cupin superfamily)
MKASNRFSRSFAEVSGLLPAADGKRFATVFEHGTLLVEIYAPRGRDLQQPHTRDEVYVVAQGKGEFIHGDDRVEFHAGDFLFAKAGVVHRFENFSSDFFTWVLFYGPEGGEAPAR